MSDFRFIYGPVPSRRLGLSLGISPIPKKTCNYSCIYCQLGNTNKLTNKREIFYPVVEIINEVKDYLKSDVTCDILTIVGEGEPTLYKDLGLLINALKELTEKPIAVITNGALLSDADVRKELMAADFVLPSIDAPNEVLFKKINRSFGKIHYDSFLNGLIQFSKEYTGKLYLETMLIKDINDDEATLLKMKKILEKIDYDRLYINAPIRPPAESDVKEPTTAALSNAVKVLGGISIEQLVSDGFYSNEKDDYSAIKSIIKRHPMNQFEIRSFLENRKCQIIEEIMVKLENDLEIEMNTYKSHKNYRISLKN